MARRVPRCVKMHRPKRVNNKNRLLINGLKENLRRIPKIKIKRQRARSAVKLDAKCFEQKSHCFQSGTFAKEIPYSRSNNNLSCPFQKFLSYHWGTNIYKVYLPYTGFENWAGWTYYLDLSIDWSFWRIVLF